MAKLWDEFSKGLADAVADIREKVVEEPMWGRVVTDRDASPQWPQAQEQQPAFGSLTHEREKAPEPDIER